MAAAGSQRSGCRCARSPSLSSVTNVRCVSRKACAEYVPNTRLPGSIHLNRVAGSQHKHRPEALPCNSSDVVAGALPCDRASRRTTRRARSDLLKAGHRGHKPRAFRLRSCIAGSEHEHRRDVGVQLACGHRVIANSFNQGSQKLAGCWLLQPIRITINQEKH